MKTKSTKHELSQDDNLPLLDIQKATAEELYSTGHTFYRQGNYAEATHFFRVMTNLVPQDHRGWMGLGASLQMENEFNGAIEAYILADISCPGKDPRIPLHAAECFWSMKKKKEAKKALRAARNRAEAKNELRLLGKIDVFETMWNKVH